MEVANNVRLGDQGWPFRNDIVGAEIRMKQGSKTCRVLGEECSRRNPGVGVCLARSRIDSQPGEVLSSSQTLSDLVGHARDFKISLKTEGSYWRLGKRLCVKFKFSPVFSSDHTIRHMLDSVILFTMFFFLLSLWYSVDNFLEICFHFRCINMLLQQYTGFLILIIMCSSHF